MTQSRDKGVLSNTNHMDSQSSPSPSIARPFKIQKLQIGSASSEFRPVFHQYDEPRPSHSRHQSPQENQEPVQNQEFHQSENGIDDSTSDPFFYYQDSHVQDSIQQCNNSLIGKILFEKPISTQIFYNTLNGIWCNPLGLKINELEGKLYQIQLEKEDDMQRILKGNPWTIRNCWLIVHKWDRNVEIQCLDFAHVPLWIQFWGLPLHCKSIGMGR
jgi:hypothetical protein